jgi:hypothetical protein
MRDLKTQLHFTVHGARKSVPELADEIGVSASYLYRACTEGESGCKFPLELLIPLMQASGDYALLDHLNARCGRITTSLPRVGRLKRKDPQVVNEIERKFHEVMAAVLKFFEAPDQANVPAITAALHAHLCEVAALKRTVADFQQQELL